MNPNTAEIVARLWREAKTLQGAGISIMQALFVSGVEKHHAVLVEHARPDNPL